MTALMTNERSVEHKKVYNLAHYWKCGHTDLLENNI